MNINKIDWIKNFLFGVRSRGRTWVRKLNWKEIEDEEEDFSILTNQPLYLTVNWRKTFLGTLWITKNILLLGSLYKRNFLLGIFWQFFLLSMRFRLVITRKKKFRDFLRAGSHFLVSYRLNKMQIFTLTKRGSIIFR